MKTQKHNKLDFRKNAIVELNDERMHEVNGGTSYFISVRSGFFSVFSIVPFPVIIN
ncbi:class I lanthipeptide [Lacinutrix sp. Hel_I_90]|uniref:class I lanthipeptide n=1 Tax=Lacinutrix sp. Hel_I_90 TaxID=1249999 RepID=UPI000B272767|nr:class I lanthipeptide [Lacinutrix sp. Hel_I_90]